MKSKMRACALVGALVLLGAVTPSSAAEAPACEGRVGRGAVVRCALRTSPALDAEKRSLDAIDGRRQTASLLLPSNPTLSVTAGRRSGSTIEPDSIVWSATLSQELEIAGQRGARLGVVDAEHAAQRQRVVAVARDVAATALAAYFDALAAREEKRVADRLVALAQTLTALAKARSDTGLATGVDADLADAAAVRLLQVQSAAERRVAATGAALTTLFGIDPTKGRVEAEGDLVPLPVADVEARVLVEQALARRADIAVANAERIALERRVDVLRRVRWPNPSVSVFALSDRYSEIALGVGLSFPIPLPAPVGQTRAGEIAETTSLAQRAAAEVERLRRTVRLEVTVAADAVASRKRELLLFDAERVKRAEQSLEAITRELEAKRLGIRDALLAQQTFVELLQGAIEARRALCLASIELARVAGASLDGAP